MSFTQHLCSITNRLKSQIISQEEEEHKHKATTMQRQMVANADHMSL